MKEFLRMVMCVFSGLGFFMLICTVLAMFNNGEVSLGLLPSLAIIFFSILFAVILDFFINET